MYSRLRLTGWGCLRALWTWHEKEDTTKHYENYCTIKSKAVETLMRLESSLICKRLRLKLFILLSVFFGTAINWLDSILSRDFFAEGDKCEHENKYEDGGKCEHADKYGGIKNLVGFSYFTLWSVDVNKYIIGWEVPYQIRVSANGVSATGKEKHMKKNCSTSFIGFLVRSPFQRKGKELYCHRLFLDLFETKIRGCGETKVKI